MSDAIGARPSLGDPLRLPCGSVLKNRIAKAAMSDSLGDGRGDATEAQARLYARWARGGVGLSIIGEVQGDARYPKKPGNLVVDASSDVVALGALAEAGSREGSMLWAQLGHAGALADSALATGRGPSALDIGDFHCDALSADDIAALPERFAQTASTLKTLGFGGVQIHAAHGFLLSQFLSARLLRETRDTDGVCSRGYYLLGAARAPLDGQHRASAFLRGHGFDNASPSGPVLARTGPRAGSTNSPATKASNS